MWVLYSLQKQDERTNLDFPKKKYGENDKLNI